WSLFFFSGRRRHTSFSRDWSSDVCSSDLLAILIAPVWAILLARSEPTSPVPLADRIVPPASAEPAGGWALADAPPSGPLSTSPQVGRASRRERGRKPQQRGASQQQTGDVY